MLSHNQKIIPTKKTKDKVGGFANESRFGGVERELRRRKVMICPSVNTGKAIKMEQAWNNISRKKDLVKVTLGKEVMIVERSDLEQCLASMSQGDELLKFTAPTLG